MISKIALIEVLTNVLSHQRFWEDQKELWKQPWALKSTIRSKFQDLLYRLTTIRITQCQAEYSLLRSTRNSLSALAVASSKANFQRATGAISRNSAMRTDLTKILGAKGLRSVGPHRLVSTSSQCHLPVETLTLVEVRMSSSSERVW